MELKGIKSVKKNTKLPSPSQFCSVVMKNKNKYKTAVIAACIDLKDAGKQAKLAELKRIRDERLINKKMKNKKKMKKDKSK